MFKRIISIFLTVIMLAASFVVPSPARAAGAYLKLADGGTHIEGSTFDIQILINTGGDDTDAADAYITYDQSLIEIIDSDSNAPGTQIAKGTIYDAYPGNVVSGGVIKLTAFSISPFNSGGSEAILATIHAKALTQTAGTALSFQFTDKRLDDSNIIASGTSQDLLTAATGTNVIITPDNIPPYVDSPSPAKNATGVVPETNLAFNIKDNDSAVDIDTVIVKVNGVQYDKSNFSYSTISKGFAITVNPTENFSYNQVQHITIDGMDTAGNAMATVDWQFTTKPEAVNVAPVLQAIGNKTVYAGDKLQFLVTATDANGGDSLTITMTGAPAGAILTEQSNGVALFEWTTAEANGGFTYPITFRVVDNGTSPLSDSESISVIVLKKDIPPCPICPVCGARTQCSNNIDDDGDGKVDLADPDCADFNGTSESAVARVNNAWNNLVSAVMKLSTEKSAESLVEPRMSRAVKTAIFRIAAGGGNSSLKLAPDTGSFYPGQEFELNLMASTDGEESNSADVVLNFVPADFELVAAPTYGSLYEMYFSDYQTHVAGQLKIAAASAGGSYNSGDGEGVFATVKFKAKRQIASSVISYEFTPGSTTDSNLGRIVDQGGIFVSEDFLSAVYNGNYSVDPDSTPPYIPSFTPANGAVNQLPNTNITFNILDSAPGQGAGVDLGSVVVNVDSVDYSTGLPGFSSTGNQYNYHITIDPAADFDWSELVNVSVTAQDLDGNSMGQYQSSFQIKSQPTNDAPVLVAIGAQTTRERAYLSFALMANDPDGGNLTYTMSGAPTGATLMKVTNNLAYFGWEVPTNTAGQTFPVTFKVTDNGPGVLSDEELVTISVSSDGAPGGICACSACPQCSDWLDNDGDGLIDMADPDCTDPLDNDESGVIGQTQCSDGQDNDGDDLIDYPYDPGCDSLLDNDETDPTTPRQCSDGRDNDSDEKTDFPYDPGCDSAADDDEMDPLVSRQCSDGADNDGDELIDFPNDPGCISAADDDETDPPEPLPACSDNMDNDGDSLIDYPADLGCDSPTDDDERDLQEIITEELNNLILGLEKLTIDNPAVEKATQSIITPLLATLAILNTVAAASGLSNLLFLLLSMFTEPIRALFGVRRQRYGWGSVYNSLTKRPIPLAIVRIFDATTDRLLQTRVTDKYGRYVFNVRDGLYYIRVTANNYSFPSEHLANETIDFKFEKLYFGAHFEIKEPDYSVITYNIPLDPLVPEPLPELRVIFLEFLRKVQSALAVSGLFVALAAVIIIPSALTIGAAALHTLLYITFKRVSVVKVSKRWGAVKDESGRPLLRAVVRLFDVKFNKLLETQITNRHGQYGFLVGRNTYYLTVEKAGYDKWQSQPIPVDDDKVGPSVTVDVRLKASEGSSPTLGLRRAGENSSESLGGDVLKPLEKAEESPKSAPELDMPKVDASAEPEAHSEMDNSAIIETDFEDINEDEIESKNNVDNYR